VSRVIKKITVEKGQFRTGIDGGFYWIAVMHTSTINEIEGVLPLRKMETRGSASDRYPEKVAERAEIGHGELGAESSYDFM
jgi:hypothetical protein